MTLDVIQSILSKIDANFLLKLSPGVILLGYSIYSFSSSLKSSKSYYAESSLSIAKIQENLAELNDKENSLLKKYNLGFDILFSFEENISKVKSLNSLQKDLCAAIGIDLLETYGVRVGRSVLNNALDKVNRPPVPLFYEEFPPILLPINNVNTFDGYRFESYDYAEKQSPINC